MTPNELATTVRFEYGTTTGYGTSTADQAIGAGTAQVSVERAGLRPSCQHALPLPRGRRQRRRHHARGRPLVHHLAHADLGGAHPVDHAPDLGQRADDHRQGQRQGSIPVALERQDFPFGNGFYQAATANANGSGNFSFTVPPLFSTTRLRVTTRTALPVSSAVITASVAVKVGLYTKRLRGKRVRITGATWPAVPAGRASLQRETRSGRWLPVRRTSLSALPNNRSRYRFIVSRRSRALGYRVVVVPNDGGAHVRGTSRVVTIPRARAR